MHGNDYLIIMKKTFLAFALCAMVLLTACEKHDGVSYFTTKCVAELNGETYIDQTPFTISPNAIITPEFIYSENEASFYSLLRTERSGEARYRVRVSLYSDEPGALLSGEQKIEKVEFEPSDSVDSDNYAWEYTKYCIDNKISYAKVNDEVVDDGTFEITSYDKEKNTYKGKFRLHFSEGTMTGEFGN